MYNHILIYSVTFYILFKESYRVRGVRVSVVGSGVGCKGECLIFGGCRDFGNCRRSKSAKVKRHEKIKEIKKFVADRENGRLI